MKVLFDINHPAQVHLFRHAIDELRRRGNRVMVTSRQKEITIELLEAYGIDHTPLSSKRSSMAGLLTEWTQRELRMIRLAWSFDPDVVVSHLSPPAMHTAALTGAVGIVFNDSENVEFVERFTVPFAEVVCTPAGFERDLGEKQWRYEGFHELAYLHPDRFEPDPDLLRSHGVDPERPYAICRFVSWDAHHDVGEQGLSPAGRRELVQTLAEYGDVYVTSEAPLDEGLEATELPVPNWAVHHLLYYADTYAGDSGTMATEAAVLGTPAVRFSSVAAGGDLSNFTELECEYDLMYTTADQERGIERAASLASDTEAKGEWQRRRERLISEKVDVTELILHVVDETTDLQ